ncbi:hypothetical protein FE391_24275 [Nonomuraea sp. KC401]|uniref:hypothetical protein n=1 Tax=unclassified Nonomuraea TaxID=2593643 RepID=UPI0010FEBEB4|nr:MULTISPECIES: hypothetical protein [unclassified Nonomuraea]NBF00389.1 hypothetical protein [Nonomuraea sp. K271]TLF66415.1 hypothetical protein FE391_24275 [Nonomuraea sp. KC401]
MSAVLSLVNLATGTPSRTFWTFPLGLPPALQVPTLVLLAAAGLVLYVIAIRALLTLLPARARPASTPH